MKYLIPFICLISLFSSCKKKTKDLLDIPLRFSTKNEFALSKINDVEMAVADSTISYTTPAIENTIPAEFSKNNLDINKVKSIKIDGLDLNIKNPPGQTFSFMRKIKIYIGANGIGETLIATRDRINEIVPAPTSLSLNAENAEIAAYVKSPTYYLRIETSLAKTYTQDILIESVIKFYAVANPVN